MASGCVASDANFVTLPKAFWHAEIYLFGSTAVHWHCVPVCMYLHVSAPYVVVMVVVIGSQIISEILLFFKAVIP